MYDRFLLTKEELALVKDHEAAMKNDNPPKVPPRVVIEDEGLDERVARVTLASSVLDDFALTADGEKLVHLSKFDEGFDLWLTKPREKKTELIAKLGAKKARLQLDAKGENAFVLADGALSKISLEDGKSKAISVKAEVLINGPAERAHIFDHVWRLIEQKFYKKDLHEVDWVALKTEYGRFLPSINNNHDFSELVSEMLGELNASHTGLRYRPKPAPENDNTGRLAAFFDPTSTGDGLKITEIVAGSPLITAKAALKPGHVIEKIDGVLITPLLDYDLLLDRKVGQRVLLSFYDPSDDRRWEAVVKPISRGAELNLLYQRWVKARRADVVRLSGGRLGYAHVRGMNDAGYRQIFDEALGHHSGAEGLIVDTRFNGGGYLTPDLVRFLSGRRYSDYAPRGRPFGDEPLYRWHKPSVVLMCEGNYSDAHAFPYAYKQLGLGKLVGMPVPGTATAVWWENLMDPTLTVGVPQMGYRDFHEGYLENQQLAPDVQVALRPKDAAAGRDTQLEAAVRVLLEQIGSKPVSP